MSKKLIKKFLSLIISIMLILSIIPLGTFTVSAKAYQDGDYTYSVENGNATITKYNGNGGDVTIPSTLGGYLVTSIGNSAFNGCSSLTSINIPNGVTSIGYDAFGYCTGLTSLEIPNSVTSIGNFAFESCSSLTSITIPNSVTSIGGYTFKGCSSLTSVIIGNSVTSIGNSAFNGCSNLINVYYYGTQSEWSKIYIDNPARGNSPLIKATKHYEAHCFIDGHIIEEGTVLKPATCTDNGQIEGICCKCGEMVTEIIPAHHTETILKTVDPTCTEDGYDIIKCSVCGDRYNKTIKALGHDYGEWIITTKPTCTQTGIETRYCSRCENFETRIASALGHNYGEWIITTKPACTQTGIETRYCSRCDELETRVVSALGHNYTTKIIKPTCTEQGYNLHTCSRCGNTYKDNFVASLGGHKFNQTGVVPANCVKDGYYIYTCSVCGEVENRIIAAQGHLFFYGKCLDCEIAETDLPFDLNLDCKANAEDLIVLRRILLGMSYNNTTVCTDVNKDGKTDILDLVRIKRHFADNTLLLGKIN